MALHTMIYLGRVQMEKSKTPTDELKTLTRDVKKLRDKFTGKDPIDVLIELSPEDKETLRRFGVLQNSDKGYKTTFKPVMKGRDPSQPKRVFRHDEGGNLLPKIRDMAKGKYRFDPTGNDNKYGDPELICHTIVDEDVGKIVRMTDDNYPLYETVEEGEQSTPTKKVQPSRPASVPESVEKKDDIAVPEKEPQLGSYKPKPKQ